MFPSLNITCSRQCPWTVLYSGAGPWDGRSQLLLRKLQQDLQRRYYVTQGFGPICEGSCYLVTSSPFRSISRTKLSLSHALLQSVKISLVGAFLLMLCRPFIWYRVIKFEELISTTIVETKEYPEIISETGKIGLPHKGVSASSIDLLTVNFILPSRRDHAQDGRGVPPTSQLQANIVAVGSVLDSPEVFWVSASAGETDQDARKLLTSYRGVHLVLPRPTTTLRRSAKLSRDPTAHKPTQHPSWSSAGHAAALEGVHVESTLWMPRADLGFIGGWRDRVERNR